MTARDNYCEYDYSYLCHVYVGDDYSGESTTVTSVQFTMTIPNGTPVGFGDEYYLELMSIWDQKDSYDQIGVADAQGGDYPGNPSSYYGSWTVFYSAGEHCFNGTPVWNPIATSLTPDDQYTFQMSAQSSGYVDFAVYYGASTSSLDWSTSVDTGATYFYESSAAPSCWGGSDEGFTDYEEMLSVGGTAQPEWNFFFDKNEANGVSVTTWSTVAPDCSWTGASPPGYKQCMSLGLPAVWPNLMAYSSNSGSVVSIWNEWFVNNPAPTVCVPNEGWCQVTIARGSDTVLSGTVTDASPCSPGPGGEYSALCSTDIDEFEIIQFPTAPTTAADCFGWGDGEDCLCPTSSSGWTCSFTGSQIENPSTYPPQSDDVVPVSYSLKISVPSSAACAENLIRLNVTDGSEPGGYAWGTFDFDVYVTGCSGGGGCVASGTPILTPEGYRPVQDLTAGEEIEEYDFLTQSLTRGAFVSGNSTGVSELVDINHGRLLLTPTEQPIYIENETFVGWLHDPQNLTVGDKIFDPVNGGWIPVTSVVLVDQKATVYDVVTSGFNNFVANGVLLDIKG